MSDKLEELLAAAARALREYEVTNARCAQLSSREADARSDVSARQAEAGREQSDVDRLTGRSLTRVLAALAGSREDALARERAEAEAARYRADQARDRLTAVTREHDAARERLARLDQAPAVYASALAAKEQYLAQSGDPRGAPLLALAGEISRAQRNVDDLRDRVSGVRDRLTARAETDQSRLTAIEAGRRALLTS